MTLREVAAAGLVLAVVAYALAGAVGEAGLMGALVALTYGRW